MVSGGINDIKLNNEMMSMLYSRSLVQTSESPKKPAPSDSYEQAPFRFLGNNEKNITILVDNPHHKFLSEEEMNVLTRMLNACGLNTGDVAIVNVSSGVPSYNDIISVLAPIRICNFGTGFTNELFTISNKNGVEVLSAAPLSQMVGDTAASKQLKAKLWTLLKQLFGL